VRDTTEARLLVPLPTKVPWWLRPGLWLTRRITGKEPLPGRLLAYFPKGAIGAGLFELTAAGEGDLPGRVLACARIAASLVCGCPFCLDMNVATWRRAGLVEGELRLLLEGSEPTALGQREAAAVGYAQALSRTPVELDAALREQLVRSFTPREVVILASTIAQVNYWSRFSQGLGVPAAGFYDGQACPLPLR